jgi:hypothetical protein
LSEGHDPGGAVIGASELDVLVEVIGGKVEVVVVVLGVVLGVLVVVVVVVVLVVVVEGSVVLVVVTTAQGTGLVAIAGVQLL